VSLFIARLCQLGGWSLMITCMLQMCLKVSLYVTCVWVCTGPVAEDVLKLC
jgi:hypothetical protein